jgi:hypothetical protein
VEKIVVTTETNDGYYEAYWPRTPRQQLTRELAPRLDTLEGKTVAQLWDELFKGDVVFDVLEEGLKKRYPGIKFVSWRTFGSTHGGNEKEALAALPQKLRDLRVDAVMSGMAC